MRGFLVLAALAVLVFNNSNAHAEEWGVDETPSGVVTIPVGLKPIWVGGDKERPDRWIPCPDDKVPAPTGTTGSYKWTYEKQLVLDRTRAHFTRPKNGTKIWFMAAVTQLHGKTAIWCVPAPKNAENAPERKTPQLLVGTDGNDIELRGPKGLPVIEGATRFMASLINGVEGFGDKLFILDGLKITLRSGWYMAELYGATLWSTWGERSERIGSVFGGSPLGIHLLDEFNLKVVIQGGQFSSAIAAPSLRMHWAVGFEFELLPLAFWFDGFWGDFLALDVKTMSGQVYKPRQSFDEATQVFDWAALINVNFMF